MTGLLHFGQRSGLGIWIFQIAEVVAVFEDALASGLMPPRTFALATRVEMARPVPGWVFGAPATAFDELFSTAHGFGLVRVLATNFGDFVFCEDSKDERQIRHLAEPRFSPILFHVDRLLVFFFNECSLTEHIEKYAERYFIVSVDRAGDLSVSVKASALRKTDPFVLAKSDPHQEQDLRVGKENSDIIHAGGVRLAVAPSAQQAPCKAVSRQGVHNRASGGRARRLPRGKKALPASERQYLVLRRTGGVGHFCRANHDFSRAPKRKGAGSGRAGRAAAL